MRHKRLIVSFAPHLRAGRTVRSMIAWRVAALTPAVAFGVYQFGVAAAVLLAVAIVAAVATEAAVGKIARRSSSIFDGHAALVGLLLAMMVPAGAPWWLVAVGAAIAILVGKMPFGPLGSSPLAPAIVGLLIVALSWPDDIRSFEYPTTASAELKEAAVAPAESPQLSVSRDPSDVLDYDMVSLVLGDQVGPIGTISPLLLLLGGLLMILRRAARWQGPVGFLLGMGLAAWVAHAFAPQQFPSAEFQLFTGMAVFGAFFLCTDWGSTPVTPMGLFLFGLTAGVLAMLLRVNGLPYARVPFAIAIVSLATPLFDRIVVNPFGKVVRHA